jgi:hypothetical protein
MRNVMHGAYKDAIAHLRKQMAHHMIGKPHDEAAEDPEEEASETPEEEALESKTEGVEGDLGLHDEHGDGMSLEEKREAMYGRKKPTKPGGMLMIIGMGKKKGKK